MPGVTLQGCFQGFSCACAKLKASLRHRAAKRKRGRLEFRDQGQAGSRNGDSLMLSKATKQRRSPGECMQVDVRPPRLTGIWRWRGGGTSRGK